MKRGGEKRRGGGNMSVKFKRCEKCGARFSGENIRFIELPGIGGLEVVAVYACDCGAKWDLSLKSVIKYLRKWGRK